MAKYELKTKKNDGDVETFLSSVDDEQKRKDAFEILEMMKDATGQAPKMWGKSIIGFGSYHYKGKSSEGEWMATGFSPRKQNLTIYIMSGFDDYADASGYNPKPLLDNLGKFKTSKGCLYINKLDDVDNKVLKQLVKESYRHVKSVMDKS